MEALEVLLSLGFRIYKACKETAVGKKISENQDILPLPVQYSWIVWFQGQHFDEETDLCYNRFRYYSPDTGLYISWDPIGLAGNNPTLYAYVRDVNNRIDPLGLDDLYALVARKDGWYPVFEYGKKNPIGEMFLKEGDLWKIGTSKDALKRYTQKYLEGVGVEMKILHTNISRKATLLLERMKIKGYEAWKGFLPPGNKCHH